MAAGQFEYQFALLLPIGIPASFESNNGHVRYTIKAVLARSWKTNYECKIPFTVNTIFDLNTTQEAAVCIHNPNFILFFFLYDNASAISFFIG